MWLESSLDLGRLSAVLRTLYVQLRVHNLKPKILAWASPHIVMFSGCLSVCAGAYELRSQTVRGPGIFKSTTFLWQIAFTVTRSLGHFSGVSNFSHRYHRTRRFLCRHYDARLKNRFPYFGSSLANNLNLDGTRAYAPGL